MTIQLAKEIEVCKTYKVKVPNLFYNGSLHDMAYYTFKQLVLARNNITIVAINLDEVKVPTRDRKKLLSLKLKDFIENDKDITQKYEEAIVIYEIEKGVIFDPMREICTFHS